MELRCKGVTGTPLTLNSYELEVEQRFAQRGALKDTETRLMKEIDGLRDDLKGVARALNDLPAQMVV